jgi:hypothetical protein
MQLLETWRQTGVFDGGPLDGQEVTSVIYTNDLELIVNNGITDVEGIKEVLASEAAPYAQRIADVVQAYRAHAAGGRDDEASEPTRLENQPAAESRGIQHDDAPAPSTAAGGPTPSVIDGLKFTGPPRINHARADGTLEATRADWDRPVVLTWPEPAAAVKVIRVIAHDDYPPTSHQADRLAPGAEPPRGYAFEVGRLLPPTTWLEDAHPYPTIRRHYVVVGYEGETLAEAAGAVPHVLAYGYAPGVLRNPIIRVDDEGRVVGSWGAPEGVTSVLVHRARVVERDRIATEEFRLPLAPSHEGYAPGDCVIDDIGFLDDSLVAATQYVYLIRAQTDADELPEWECPEPFERAPRLDPVTDLHRVQVEGEDDQATCLVQWTNPVDPEHEVWICRTTDKPTGQTRIGKTVRLGDLEQFGLRRDQKERGGDTKTVPSGDGGPGQTQATIKWSQSTFGTGPTAPSSLYLTPVVVSKGYICVGRTLQLHHVPTPREVRLVERVTRQFVTFAWPGGASHVRLGVVQLDVPRAHIEESSVQWTNKEIDRKNYDDGGSLDATGSVRRGQAVTVQGFIIADRAQVYGRMSPAVRYDGLDQVSYTVGVSGESLVVRITPKEPIYGRVLAFALVGSPSLLPLAYQDSDDQKHARGTTREDSNLRTRLTFNGLTGFVDCWFQKADLAGSRYIRLVLTDVTVAATVAVLDPPVDQLFLS